MVTAIGFAEFMAAKDRRLRSTPQAVYILYDGGSLSKSDAMLEILGNLGEFVGGFAVVVSLIYVAWQLRETRKQMRAQGMQQRIATRIDTWRDQADWEAYRSASEKIFEDELYRRDCSIYDLEELNFAERQSIQTWVNIELLYFHNLFYQRQMGTIDPEQSLPLDYMLLFQRAFIRWQWRHGVRLSGHYDADFIQHVDRIVAIYDQIEQRLSADENAEFNALFREFFKIPQPPTAQWEPK